MKLFFYLLLFIVLVAFGLTFALKNSQLIELNYYPDIVISSPLVVVLLVTLLLGVLIGVLVMSVSRFSRHRELKRAQKENKKLSEEIQNLRSLPIKETI
jgi:lipopolysaccharide assembly protein A